MKNDIADILFKYTTGEATLEETNDALKEAEAGFNLEPGRNEITPDEMALTTVGDTPEEANGFGLLDTGTGSIFAPYRFIKTEGELPYGAISRNRQARRILQQRRGTGKTHKAVA